jgi:hypothetical protein
MSNQAFATTDDEEISWADITIVFSLDNSITFEMIECEGLKWDGKVECGFSFGTSGGRALKRTRGKAKYSGSGTFSKSMVDRCEAALAAVAPSRGDVKLISVPSFSVVVQHKTISNPGVVYQTELIGCRWLGNSEDNKEGTDALFQEVPLDPIDVIKTLANGTRVSLL